MEELDKIGPLIDVGDLEPSGTRRNKERRSFYDVPRTLSEEDDTFGILTLHHTTTTMSDNISALVNKTEGESDKGVVSTGLLVEIDSSQSSSGSPGPVTRSMLQSSKIETELMGRQSSVSSSRGMSVSSVTNSRCFGDLSHISSLADQTSGRSLLSNDSVFDSKLTDQDPNWEMIMNEAKILASSINKDPAAPKQKIKSTSSRLLGNFSPSEDGLDSPLLDLEKEFSKPDEFLVPLTPDRSPVKDLRKEITQDVDKQNLKTEELAAKQQVSDSRQAANTANSHPPLPADPNSYPSLPADPCSSPPLPALPEHEIDGVAPPPPSVHDKDAHATPKMSVRQTGRNSMSKGKVVKPRQLLGGTPLRTSADPTLNNSVEKQVKSKVQQSNVRRTSMTNPSLLSQQQSATKHRPDRQSTGGQSVDKRSVGGQKARLSISGRSAAGSKAGTPVVNRTMGTPVSNRVDYKNVQSRINTGMMPTVKNSLTKGGPANTKLQLASSAKKPLPVATSGRKIAPGLASGKVTAPRVTGSACKKPPTPMTAPKGVLQRQGSNITVPPRPSSTTPLKSRQSLSFATPAAVAAVKPLVATKQPIAEVTTRPAAVPRSGLKPPTPSRLPGPGVRTPSMGRPGVLGGGQQVAGGGARVSGQPGSRPLSGQQQPKSRSSLRFSALPSPSVSNKENMSLVCSTPAVVNPARSASSSGLPSPIRAKRRGV